MLNCTQKVQDLIANVERSKSRGEDCGVGSWIRVRWTRTKARQVAISFEVVEWSEQLRLVTSAWLGAVRRSVRTPLVDWLSNPHSKPDDDQVNPGRNVVFQ